MTKHTSIRDWITFGLSILIALGTGFTIYNNSIYVTKAEAKELVKERKDDMNKMRMDIDKTIQMICDKYDRLYISVNELDKKIDVLAERIISKHTSVN